jgi:hypothetical protein
VAQRGRAEGAHTGGLLRQHANYAAAAANAANAQSQQQSYSYLQAYRQAAPPSPFRSNSGVWRDGATGREMQPGWYEMGMGGPGDPQSSRGPRPAHAHPDASADALLAQHATMQQDGCWMGGGGAGGAGGAGGGGDSARDCRDSSRLTALSLSQRESTALSQSMYSPLSTGLGGVGR